MSTGTSSPDLFPFSIPRISKERHIFHTTVTRVTLPTTVERGVVVLLRLFKQRRFWKDDPEDFTQDGEPSLVTEVALLVNGPANEDLFAANLLRMGVPAEQHEHIFLKFLQQRCVRNLDNIAPNVPYSVNILDISASLLGCANYSEIVRWVAQQPIVFENRWGPKFIPASRSWINSLRKVRVDSLEGDLGSCAVCLNNFRECVDQLATFLPCKHLYHADCIAQSLRTCHLCPLCRHPMPTVKAEEQ